MDAKSSAQRIQELRGKGKALIQAKADSGLSEDDRKVLADYKAEIDRITDELAQAKVDSDAGLMAIINGGKPVDGGDAEDGAKLSSSVVSKFSQRLAYKAAGLGSRQYKSEAEPGDFGATFGTKALALSNATDVLVQDFAADPERPLSLLDVIPTKKIGQPTFRYNRQTVRDLNAAPVAVGALKPESKIGIEGIDRSLEVIAHVTEGIDKYSLQDVDSLKQFIEAEMRYGIMLTLEQQLVNGTGVAPELFGIVGTSGVQVQAAGTDIAATVRSSLTKLETLGYAPTAIVLSPADWETVETMTTSGSGEFVFASSPVDRAARKLWGVPLVTSSSLPANKALVLSQGSVTLYTDGNLAMEWDTVGDDFQRNQVRARFEGRFQTAVPRPQGIVLASLPVPVP